MLQYSLLFLEIILLGAMAYLYVTTRKTVEESIQGNLATSAQSGKAPGAASVTQMAQEVTHLMEELQTITSDTRADLLKQRDNLQELLGQTEAAATELRLLLNQVEQPEPAAEPAKTSPAFRPWQPANMSAASAAPQPDPEADSGPLVPLELIYSPSQFGEYLHISGCGPEVVSLATEHAQEFVIWFTNQFDDDEAPPRLIDRRYLEEYQQYMEGQRLGLDTIKRRLIALQAYINWANNISQLGDAPAAPQPEPDPETENKQLQAVAILRSPEPPPEKQPVQKETDRYHTVLALAEQGLDQLAIAARTGLEQEAVRMIMILKKRTAATG